MKILKRLFLILFIFLVLIVGALLAVPFIFKDELVDVVKEQINQNINATADFAEVDVSLFRSFPHLSLQLSDFSLVGKDRFADIPFLGAKEAGITVDIRSLFGNQPLSIRSVNLDQPNVNVLVLEDGAANYDITIPTEEEPTQETTDASALEIALQSYEITDGTVTYDDRAGDIYLAISGLNHSGEGNFTLTEYDLDTKTTIASMSVRQDGISYLKNAELALDAIFHIDAEKSLYVLKDNQLRVNELLLNAEGQIQLLEEDILLDLAFNSPGSDFRSLWSLIPNAYTKDYEDVAINGTFNLEGLVKGTYNETTYPAFRIRTQIKDGNVKYPDLPLGISNIQAALDVNSPSSDLDQMVINAEKIALTIGKDPFTAQFNVKTPISDPDVKANVDGVIDLGQWAQAFPMEGIQEMTGRITADVDIQTRLSTIEKEAYEQVRMAGSIGVSNLKYVADGLPAIVINSTEATFTPQKVNVADFSAKLGKSDLRASGSIDNILAYISPEKTMRGRFTAHTDYFLVDEWMTEEAPTTAVPSSEPVEETEIFDRFDFQVDATANRIVYDTYELTEAAMTGRIQPNRMEVSQMRSKLGASDFSGNGLILNAFDYAFNDGTLRGDLTVKSGYFDLNPFMEETTPATSTTGSTEEAYGVIPIPENINMVIRATVDRLQYTDMELKDLKGKLTIADQTVVIEDGTARTLGGNLGFTGAYDTQDIAKPTYQFKFDLDKLDFKESFNTFNSFAAFAPVGKLVNGKFSSSLIMSGELGQDMMPTLESINAQGLFETLNGSLEGLKPLTAIGNALDISELKKSITLDRLKTWFTIENGTFAVEPFDIKVADLPMNISGTHSLTQEMNYAINTVIPRSKLGNNQLGNTINQGLSSLVKQANQLGVNVNDAENLNVRITLTGNITDPKVGFKLLGADGETTVAEAVKDEAKALVNEQVNAAKDQVQQEVNQIKDKATQQATALADSVKNAAANQLKQSGQSVLDQVTGTNTPKDSTATLKEQAGDAVDKIKEDIKDFNPFRKKKGGGE
ncbi:AsmA-like C-terminal region-containing protein [Lewinella sp. LCG006]|uniref:DUF748 domain-containing protein n=1 Tax=Lewinella sp. LCG006 TaxID=3231911 RepID=UPI003460449B